MKKRTIIKHRIAIKWAQGIWSSINQRTINGKYNHSLSVLNNYQHKSYLVRDIRCEITKEELVDFAIKNEKTILDIYSKGDRPSIDRINSEGHYSLDNIQIIPRIKNLLKGKNIVGKDKSKELEFIANRKRYISSQLNPRPKVIDRYLSIAPRYLVKMIDMGLIPDYNDFIDRHQGIDLTAADAYFNSILESEERAKETNEEKRELLQLKALKRKEKIDRLSLVCSKKLEARNHPKYREIYQRIKNQGITRPQYWATLEVLNLIEKENEDEGK